MLNIHHVTTDANKETLFIKVSFLESDRHNYLEPFLGKELREGYLKNHLLCSRNKISAYALKSHESA